MIVKTKIQKPKPTKPVRRTSGDELMVYQVNEPGVVGSGVNHKNKNGVLALGDDGQYLRNVKVDPDGTVVVRHDKPVNVVMGKVEVGGTVNVDNTVTVKPVTVANMPDHIRIQENLQVVQNPIKAEMVPFSFESYGQVIVRKPCKIYSIYLTVCEPTFVELVGITGEIWTREFKFDLFPLFIQRNMVEIKTREYVKIGGYILYESC